MRMTARLLPLLAVLLVLGAAPTSAEAAEASRQTIKVDGVRRSYLLYKPRNKARAAECDVSRSGSRVRLFPLVLVMHGGGGTARGLYRDTRDSYTALADKHGFYVVYPNAVRRMWDFGSGKVSEELKVRTDDRQFFADLIDHLTATLPINKQRVFATGISRGGQASYFMACQFPERIRAIAPITMPMPEFMAADCGATGDVGLVLINGTDDPIVPYDGGPIVARGKDRGEVLSTAATLDIWRERNGCTARPASVQTIDPVADNTVVERSDWTNCSGAPVRFYRVEGGGHTWPSGSQYLPVRVVGEVTRDIDGAVEAWDFFSRFK